MNFFARQEQARRNSGRLAAFFALAVLGTSAATYFALAAVFAFAGKESSKAPGLWNPGLFLITTGVTLGVILIGALVKMAQLRGGGSAVAQAMGGRPADPHTRDPHERQLLNVVEEMSIASGVPMPEVFILDEEEGINAFAAGHTMDDAAIGVTRGCMKQLTRDELQGVVAHEFSHILNGDMKLNVRLIGFIGGILALTVIGRVCWEVARASGRSREGRKNAGFFMLLGVVLIVVGSLGALFARLIQAAVSRQREFLADASAVQFTRLPEGIAGALKKIGGLAHGSRLHAATAAEAGHLFFSNGLSAAWMNALATHPPLDERIRAIDPRFDGAFPKVTQASARIAAAPDAEPPRKARPPVPPLPLPGALGIPGMPGIPGLPTRLTPDEVLHQAGTVREEHLQFAAGFRATLPAPLQAAVKEPFGATALVYALLLNEGEGPCLVQLQALTGGCPEPLLAEVRRLHPLTVALPQQSRLPLADLALPALRRMSSRQFADFERDTRALIEADNQVDLFEFALQQILLRHLAPTFRPVPPVAVEFYTIKAISNDCAALLSALAHVGGGEDATAAEKAFRAGLSRLPTTFHSLPLTPLADCTLGVIEHALNHCRAASPSCRATVLDACAHAVAHDGIVQSGEAELLRAIADALGCPLPPLLTKAA